MPRHPLQYFGLVLLCVLAAAGAPDAESSPNWLDRLNFYRASASLPPVTEDLKLSAAIGQHARYMVMHGAVKHVENRRDSWATPEGAAAAAVSNLAGSTSLTEPDSWAVDVWMQAPFHALGILDPALSQVGFGIQHARNSDIQTAAGLDVTRGRRSAPPRVAFPVVWPADGSAVPLATHVSESPSPLTSCPGYEAPSGLPLIVQIGAGKEFPRVTGSWLSDDEGRLELCAFDEGTYKNRDAAQQQLGRSILAAHDAIVLIPRRPLRQGIRYRAVVDVNGRRIEWTFKIQM